MTKLNDAISKLASLYEYGELQADTDPVEFVKTVTDDVQSLRAEVERLRDAATDALDVLDQVDTWADDEHDPSDVSIVRCRLRVALCAEGGENHATDQ